jgi:hypothetical protein
LTWSAEKIWQYIKMGEQTCFTLQSLIEPVPTQTHVRLNGEDLMLEEPGE